MNIQHTVINGEGCLLIVLEPAKYKRFIRKAPHTFVIISKEEAKNGCIVDLKDVYLRMWENDWLPRGFKLKLQIPPWTKDREVWEVEIDEKSPPLVLEIKYELIMPCKKKNKKRKMKMPK